MVFTVSPVEKQELLVTFATLVLHDDKAPITEENINKLIKAAGGHVEPYWPKLFANLLKERDVGELLLNAGGGGVGVAAGAAPAEAAAEEAEKEEEVVEEEEEEESDEDMGFSLFD